MSYYWCNTLRTQGDDEKRVGVNDWFNDKNAHRKDAIVTPTMPLAMACAGQKLCIQSLAGGRGLRQRLTSMGLNVGSQIEIIRQGNPGPVLIVAGGTRLAIGAGMAQKITVSELKALSNIDNPGNSI